MDDLFTKRKFLNLPEKQQFKKCAEILRVAYINESKEALDQYNVLMGFLGKPFLSNDLKEIADAYHLSLQLSDTCFKEHNLLPNIRKGDRDYFEKPFDIDIYLDQIRSGHNVGSIIRTVEAFSLGELFFSKGTPFITNKKVQDAAMNADKNVKSHQGISLSDLKRPIIVLETSEQAVSLNDFVFPESFTLVCGNEEYGCSDETLKLADHIIEIPLRGRKNSLNVANAFAIAASAISQQLTKHKV